MKSEVQERADFQAIRYAQVWEDADILLEALAIQPGDTCVSIASAGDNALAMLAKSPAKVYALDLNPAQLACLELRVAAYRCLTHEELLILIGSRPPDPSAAYTGEPSDRIRALSHRGQLYLKCRPLLSKAVRAFWDDRSQLIEAGIGSLGKFERYFAIFRNVLLPLVHSQSKTKALLRGGTLEERRAFYSQQWDTWRWRLLFKFFFSRTVMGKLGRDPAFFRYVQGSVADRILSRTRHALVELNPAENPYMHWILTGTHGEALPFALRRENFDLIRRNLDRLEWRCQNLEDFLQKIGPASLDAFNLSDIFEYMSEENYHRLLTQLVQASRPGARLAYWNMLAPRSRPESMASQLREDADRSRDLLSRDKAFFYSAFILEEVLPA